MHANKQLVNSENWSLYWSVTVFFPLVQGGTVHIVCRNKERAERAREEIISASGNTVSVWFIAYDASTFNSECKKTPNKAISV